MVELDRDDFLAITYTIANMMLFIAGTLLIPALVAFVYGEQTYVELFIGLALFVGVVFFSIRKMIGAKRIRTRHAVISIAVQWILLGLLAALPFIAGGLSPVDAFFESVSGWTGTGLTMIATPENLPHALNFWRGFIQWLGGFGIVLMALLLYERPQNAQNLFFAEGRNEEFNTNVRKIAFTIAKIYAAYTLMGVVLLLFSGLSLFDALIHSFTSIATGGFSTNSVGVGYYGASAMLASMLLMLLGGISFESHYLLSKKRFKELFASPELRFFFAVIVLAVGFLFVNFYFFKENHFFDGVFYVISAISGTGATSALAVGSLPALSVFILILLMIFGSCYGSTTGALKLWRILILAKVIRREIHMAFLPEKSIMPIKVGNKIVSDEAALKAVSYIGLYLVLLMLGSIIFMLFGYGLIDAVFSIASAQGNVGLASFAGSAWFAMHPLLKILLSIHMLVGRMEIIPFFVLAKGLGIGNKIR